MKHLKSLLSQLQWKNLSGRKRLAVAEAIVCQLNSNLTKLLSTPLAIRALAQEFEIDDAEQFSNSELLLFGSFKLEVRIPGGLGVVVERIGHDSMATESNDDESKFMPFETLPSSVQVMLLPTVKQLGELLLEHG